MTSHAADEKQAAPPMRRRGDRHRQAILRAARELLEETPFAELSVRAISLRAGVARSGFYFYFDSKYSVLAQILAEATEELEEASQHFSARQPGESPEQFVNRMIGSVAGPQHRVAARQSDMEIRDILERQFQVLLRETIGVFEAEVKAGTAHPISEDLPTLVRTLAATTALMLTGDALLVGPDSDAARRVRVLEQMWLNALWGGGKAP